MSQIRNLSLAALFCMLATLLSLVSAEFVPHKDNDAPVYNFNTFQPNRVLYNGTFIYVGPQYITPAILWGIGVVFFLLTILYVALGCLMSIQRPVKFSPIPLVLAKEY